jgi:DNA repair protein RadC
MLLREIVATYMPAKRLPELEGRIGSSRDVDALMRSAALRGACVDLPVEAFIVLHLNAKNRVIGWHRAGLGGTSTCPVEAGAVFRPLLLSGACGLICVHNHPSGEPAPSPEDVALTERLASGAKLLGLGLLDHVIVCSGCSGGAYFSFLDHGMVERRA